LKNGLLVYSNKYELFNLGDYVQSLAARQFLGPVDVHVCRESLDTYAGEEIRLILNGWFTHEPDHWPPSDRIRPLFVSFHVNSVARRELTNERSIAYLKRWSPIGCRDHGTVQLLRGFGVDAYFSGCLTTTLGRTWMRGPSDGSIYFVDPHFDFGRDARSVARYARELASHFRTIAALSTRMFGNRQLRSLLKSAAFFRCYRALFTPETLLRATYIRQELPNSGFRDDAAKFARAEDLLRRYSAAKFVVTSRIHCALPCLGIGTPVLYVEDQGQPETSRCRLEGLRELLNVVRHDGGRLQCDLATGPIGPCFSFENKKDFRVLAEDLSKRCEAFLGSADDRAGVA
jgi:hypothetical protein